MKCRKAGRQTTPKKLRGRRRTFSSASSTTFADPKTISRAILIVCLLLLTTVRDIESRFTPFPPRKREDQAQQELNATSEEESSSSNDDTRRPLWSIKWLQRDYRRRYRSIHNTTTTTTYKSRYRINTLSESSSHAEKSSKEDPTTKPSSKPKKSSSTKSPKQLCPQYTSQRHLRNKVTRLWYRRHRKPKAAYRMAIMASMSYWEFQKWGLPSSSSSDGEDEASSSSSSSIDGFQLIHKSRRKRVKRKIRQLAVGLGRGTKHQIRYWTSDYDESTSRTVRVWHSVKRRISAAKSQCRSAAIKVKDFAIYWTTLDPNGNTYRRLQRIRSIYRESRMAKGVSYLLQTRIWNKLHATWEAIHIRPFLLDWSLYITELVREGNVETMSSRLTLLSTTPEVQVEDPHPADVEDISLSTEEEAEDAEDDIMGDSFLHTIKGNDPNRFIFQYWLYNWYEPSFSGVNFHDTDVLIATSANGKQLIVSFGGTSSAADAVTNLQTFEPANHSGFFHGGKPLSVHRIQGSLHRGFLNAYSRVERGSIVRLCSTNDCKQRAQERPADERLLRALHRRFGHCSMDSNNKRKKKSRLWTKEEEDEDSSSAAVNTNTNTTDTNTTLIADAEDGWIDKDRSAKNIPDHVKERKSGGCHSRGELLVDVLRELVRDALESGIKVHLTGHSLGGGLASLLGFDMIVNFPSTPVSKLNIWTFGSPQTFDDMFLKSAMALAPRLASFVRENGNGRFHRFVTLSDDCQVDVVSEVAKNTLPSHRLNLHGRAARRLGGVHGHIIHVAQPHYLLTPYQYDLFTNNTKALENSTSTTQTPVAAHATRNYLSGVSRESRDHPLQTDLPRDISKWLGEDI